MQYYPGQLPQNWDPRLIEAELRKLAEVLSIGSDLVRILETNTLPGKITEGEMRIADGVNWNPGRGAGTYIFRRGIWNLIEDGFNANAQSRQFFLSE